MIPHLFISAAGDLLPRWQEAFPKARSVAPGETSKDEPALVWLRLTPGQALAEQISLARRPCPDAPIVVLSDEPNDTEALAAFSAAARGYCNTHATAGMLRQVAQVVQQGGLWIGESLMQRLVSATTNPPVTTPDRRDWAAKLTSREQTVASAIASGASNKEIARQLKITERTVKAHVSAVLEKLQVRDRLQISLRINGRRSNWVLAQK